MDTQDTTIRFETASVRRKKVMWSIVLIVVFCVIGIFVIRAIRMKTGLSLLAPITTPTPTPDPMEPKNILILGYGGAGHEGGLLTDTMIIGRIVPKQKKVILISIPRDLWVPVESKEGTTSAFKVNAVYAVGSDDRAYPDKSKKYQGNGGGIRMAEDVVGAVTGLPISWSIAVDFSGFIKLMEKLGGIFVDVPFSFEDKQYPLEGKENDTCGKSDDELKAVTATLSGELLEEQFQCRYETLKFEKGKQFMDGMTALKFVRSRHSNINGGDFGRSVRQQAFLLGVKNRLLSFSGASKIIPLSKDALGMVASDITLQDVTKMAQLYGSISSYTLDSIQLTDETVLTFSNSPDGQSILVPKSGPDDWGSILQYINQQEKRIEEASQSAVVQ